MNWGTYFKPHMFLNGRSLEAKLSLNLLKMQISRTLKLGLEICTLVSTQVVLRWVANETRFGTQPWLIRRIENMVLESVTKCNIYSSIHPSLKSILNPENCHVGN